MKKINRLTALRYLILVIAANLILLPYYATRANAMDQRQFATCQASIPINMSPGLWLTKQTSGTNQSFGQTGTLDCDGYIDGYKITGPGKVGFSATYSGTCSFVAGGGVWSFSVPIDKNGHLVIVTKSGTYNGPSFAAQIVFDGEFNGGTLKGVGSVTREQGDCVNTPVTKGMFNFTGLELRQ